MTPVPRSNPTRTPAVFLDRDGVLNRFFVRGRTTHPPCDLGEFQLLPGVAAALQRLKTAGFPLVVVTNQPDVSRGVTSHRCVEEIHDHIRATLPVLDVLVCYHDSADHCGCRKPRPGLLHAAARRWPIDLARSFLVGDRWSDILAGQAVGCTSILVETPYSGRHRCIADGCVADLAEAVTWILDRAFRSMKGAA
ncbi:MAG: HAD family hydrolase [Gemmataceae bacterium]|nr:HAD family hydrolase [Gemmataceae bacterium]